MGTTRPIEPTLESLARVLAAEPQAGADRSLERLMRETGGAPDPSRPEHVIALRVWLNAWACRIPYPKDGVDVLVDSLCPWWTVSGSKLPNGPLAELDDRGIDELGHAYAALVGMPSGVNRSGHLRSLAPTASSKLLWVLRPETACPWDKAIAAHAQHGAGMAGYVHHLRTARAWSQQVMAEAAKAGLESIAAHVGRPQSSLVRLYDEWCYLTFTRGAERAP